MVQPRDAAELPRCDVPAHAVVAEVGQRMAQRGQLPVEDGQHARLARVEDQVVEPVVAVHDAGDLFRLVRHVLRQPVDQAVHGRDRLGLRQFVLLAPALDLAREVVARLAVVGQADGGVVHAVQRGDHAVHFVVDRRALGAGHAGQGLVPQHAALHELHDVEGAADHGLVLAQRTHPGDRHVRPGERIHHAVLALDGVRRRQQLGFRPRFGAHHVGA